jgi:hypothetical protein
MSLCTKGCLTSAQAASTSPGRSNNKLEDRIGWQLVESDRLCLVENFVSKATSAKFFEDLL